jgi:hypothetical protein
MYSFLPRKSWRTSKKKVIALDPNLVSSYYYKKDDWKDWANPMLYSILDNLVTLEKMRLADLAALDGAISNIRLWKLGNAKLGIASSLKQKESLKLDTTTRSRRRVKRNIVSLFLASFT